MRATALAVAFLIALAATPVKASDDTDLIPEDVLEPASNRSAPPEPASRPSPSLYGKFFAEEAFSLWSQPRSVPVPYPPAPLLDWQNRVSFDANFQWRASPRLTLTLSDRVNVFVQDGQSVVSADTVHNDLREASVTWQPAAQYYLEAGRINVRNGAALGFNPTDFFKTRTLVGQASLDPSVIRQNRLGTLLLRAQTLWAWGSSSIAYAPKVVAEASPVSERHPVGVDPHFDATNAAHRVLCTLSFELFDLSPQLLGYFELHRSKLGASVTRSLGDVVVAYVEWAAGPEQDLSARAVAFGRQTGTLPASALAQPPTGTQMSLQNDLAAGFS